MAKSGKDVEKEALKAALKREQKKVANLKSQHKAYKTEIKNLKRRKDPQDKVKSKKKDRRETKVIKVTEKQRQLLSNVLPGIDILSLLSD